VRSFEISKFQRRQVIQMAVLAALLFIVTACATPIGITRVDPRTAQRSLTANALSADKPSSFSMRELLNRNLYDRFDQDPVKALAELHAGLSPTGDEDLLFALAELSFFHADQGGDRSYYLTAAAYAYSFLLPGQHGTSPRPIDPRGRWAVDLYNRGLARGLSSDDGEQVLLKGGQFKLPFGELTVELNEADLIWAGFRLKNFVSAAELEIRGLRNRYRRPGVGAPLVASIEPVESSASAQAKRIPPRLKVPVTVFLRFNDARGALASGKLSGRLEVFNPDSAKSVKIEDRDVPIEYEITAALADMLEGAPVWDFEIAGFRSGDFGIGDKKFGDGLFMLGPHRHGQVPVVLVHGTASSPARWAELFNELANDPQIFDAYEVWLFMYNTGNPIAYSASLLRDALTSVVKELDPEGKDPGLKQMVVMGHSQGGLLTKMTVIDSGTRLWPFRVPPEELDLSPETRDLLTRALLIKPLPFVRRVVFIATPHRGSYQALGFFGNLASWLVNLPGRFTKLSLDLVRLQTKGLLLGPMSGIPTSITNMNPNNRFIQALGATPIAEGVVAHSIVAVDSDGPLAEGGDGVVKYLSAHIDGVASEKIVRSGHSTQGHPETIQEVKRILIEHAKTLR
jgi:pimeloyl-ACP methyl ester carboxylesterase